MQITGKLSLGGALAIAALMGCGGNSSGGGFTTSVPSGTKLTSLTPQQAMQLCTDFAATAPTPDLCKLVAIEATALSLTLSSSLSSSGPPSDATLQMACAQTYNGCLSGDGGTTSGCDPSTFTTEPATCTATVGDLTACANTDLTLAKQEVAGLPSCSSVTSANLLSALATLASEADAGTSMSATCTALESNCNKGPSSSSTVGLVTVARRFRR